MGYGPEEKVREQNYTLPDKLEDLLRISIDGARREVLQDHEVCEFIDLIAGN